MEPAHRSRSSTSEDILDILALFVEHPSIRIIKTKKVPLLTNLNRENVNSHSSKVRKQKFSLLFMHFILRFVKFRAILTFSANFATRL